VSKQSGSYGQYFPQAPADVWTAATRATAEFTRVGVVEGLRIDFKTRASLATWGQNMSVSLEPAHPGTRVVVAGVGKLGSELATEGRIKKVSDAIIRYIGTALDGVPPEQSADVTDRSPLPPVTLIAEELTKLSALLEKGVLTTDEFATAKAKLLHSN
jgi:hypothetical protein